MKKLSVKAAAVTAASSGRPVQVAAAYDESVLGSANAARELSKATYVEHVCNACGTHEAVSSAVAQPLCVTCGSADVVNTKRTVASSFVRDEDLVSVCCPDCGTQNVLDARVVRAAKHKVHCVTCGAEVSAADPNDPDVPNPASVDPSKLPPVLKTTRVRQAPLIAPKETADAEDDIDDEVTLDDLDDMEEASLLQAELSPPPEFDSIDPYIDGSGVPNTSESRNDLRVPSPRVGEGDAALVGPGDLGLDVADAPGIGDDLPLIFADVTDNPKGKSPTTGDDFRVEVESDLDDDIGDIGDPTGEPLMDTTEIDDTVESLSFVRCGSRLVAMKGHVSVASLTPTGAGDNRDIMFSDSFAGAIVQASDRMGMRAALDHFKFVPVRAGKVQETAIASRVQAMQRVQAAADKKRLAERSEILALAAAGLSRNFWKGFTNPLTASITEYLRSQGVRRPEIATSRLTRDAGMAYAEVLLQVAAKLETMSSTVRNEFADALNLTQDPGAEYVEPVAESDVLDGDYTVDDLSTDDGLDLPLTASAVSQRLTTPGRSTRASNAKVPALLTASHSQRTPVLSESARAFLEGRSAFNFTD